MNLRNQLIFWITSFVILTLLFSKSLGGLVMSLYFVTFLFPVVLGTTLIFNRVLVHRYLLNDRKGKFVLYFLYLLVLSVYLEMLVMILAFIILADYRFENLGSIAGDIYLLAVILYLIVFINGFMEIVSGFQKKSVELRKVAEQKERDKEKWIMIRSNRQNINIEINAIGILESLGDYVKVQTKTETHLTKQKISVLERSMPSHFIRIHRSFLINSKAVQSFNKESVIVGDRVLNFGRKYKNEALAHLSSMAGISST